jgi:uncharacterized protein DUF6184
MNRIRNTLLVLFAGTAAFACMPDDRPTANVGKSYTPPAPERQPSSMSNDQVAHEIANERCAREQRCGEIGPDEDYSTKQACLQDMYSSSLDKLGVDECPGGVDKNDLAKCLTEIRNEDCDNPADSFERMMSCRGGMLCID